MKRQCRKEFYYVFARIMSKRNMLLKYTAHALKASKRGHGIHSPFVYELVENVFYNENLHYVFEELNTIRAELKRTNTIIDSGNFGAGSRVFKSATKKISDIARHGISTKKQSEIIFRLINYLNLKVVVELGTSLGLNSLYMAKAGVDTKVYTIEGAKDLHDFAKQLFEKTNTTNIELIKGHFNEVLKPLLQELNTVSLVYIDGNHTYDATISYFNTCIQHTNENSVLVFDDIYWSEEMEKAWKEIANDSRVNLSIDCFYFGMVFFRKENKQKEHYKLLV